MQIQKPLFLHFLSLNDFIVRIILSSRSRDYSKRGSVNPSWAARIPYAWWYGKIFKKDDDWLDNWHKCINLWLRYIYITYTTKHTKKLAWFEHWCQVSSVWCSRSPFVVIGLCKFCTISAVHQIRVGLLLVAFTIPKIRIPFLIFYNTICLSFIYR